MNVQIHSGRFAHSLGYTDKPRVVVKGRVDIPFRLGGFDGKTRASGSVSITAKDLARMVVLLAEFEE